MTARNTYTPGVRVAFAELDLADPSNAFAYGMALGMAIEREASDPANDAIHRAALGQALKDIARADARAHEDGPQEPFTPCTRCGRSWPWPAQARECCVSDSRPGGPRRG